MIFYITRKRRIAEKKMG